MKTPLVLAGAIVASCLAVLPAAAAQIINIDATSDAGVTLMLDPGSYTLEVVGMAAGGAYDAWNSGCDDAPCAGPTPWREDFAFSTPAGITLLSASTGNFQPTALAALANWQSQATLFRLFNAAGGGFMSGTIAAPPLLNLGQAANVQFYIATTDYTNNLGGVSLRLTAVPEPGVWLMLVVGFGFIGAAVRARGPLARSVST